MKSRRELMFSAAGLGALLAATSAQARTMTASASLMQPVHTISRFLQMRMSWNKSLAVVIRLLHSQKQGQTRCKYMICPI